MQEEPARDRTALKTPPPPRGRALLVGYIVLLHVVLLVLLFKTDFLLLAGKTLGLTPPEEWTPDLVALILEQAEQDLKAPPGQVALVGDSHVSRLDVALMGAGAINFGIGGDTTHTLLARLPVLRSLPHSRAVVLEIGVNDLKYRPVEQIARDYDALFERLPQSPLPIFAVSVLPVDENGPAAHHRPYLRNAMIGALNREIRRVCAAHAQCRYLDAGPAMANPAVYSADGWHLSPAGNRALAGVIRGALPPVE